MPWLTVPLTHEGAVVEVLIGVSDQRAATLQSIGQTPPPPIQARLLVDTGATSSCVELGLVSLLGLVPTGYSQMLTASTETTPVNCDQYDVSILFPSAVPSAVQIRNVAVIEISPLQGTYQGLLGRDVIDSCVMSYNPLVGAVTLSF